MALAVCWLFDRRSDRLLRNLWARLEDLGVPTLLSHTHGRHVPHISLAVLREWDLDEVTKAVQPLLTGQRLELYFDALGTFRRGRAWLAPAADSEVLRLQEDVVSAVTLTAAVYDVLPLEATADRAALVDSATGQLWPL
ncbi:2'-5' RNA ligase family protein [Kribbella sp. GL6]|uniref:2'-5' RNA ligase family protein n=1 Tax=Kribbella sp. GL6 TaxID=3419765 RepID=UPI003CFC91E2